MSDAHVADPLKKLQPINSVIIVMYLAMVRTLVKNKWDSSYFLIKKGLLLLKTQPKSHTQIIHEFLVVS